MKKKECWSKTYGERGNRVRVYEPRPGAPLWRSVYINGKENRKALGHRDRQRAEREAYQLLAQLAADTTAIEQGTLTLLQLAEMYKASPAFADKKEKTRQEDTKRLDRVVHFLGADREADTLTESDVRRFAAARRAGNNALLFVQRGVAVRERSVQADLVTLHTMLNWGAKERGRNGKRLIPENPLRGVAIPKEKNPTRPVVTHDVFKRLVEVAPEVHPLLRLALVVAEGTGRRLSAWRQLRWADVNFEEGNIRWPAETDKKGYEQTVPMSESVRDELLAHRQDRPGIGAAWVFPSPKDPSKACDRHLLDNWLRKAYKLASLEPKKGGLWHSFRRKWATERKAYPVADVAAAGGWRDTRTLHVSYLHADAETIRTVVLNPSHRLVSGG